MKGRSVFTIVGMIVVAIILLVIIYFAWIGWQARGKPVPDVDMETQGALIHSGDQFDVTRDQATVTRTFLGEV